MTPQAFAGMVHAGRPALGPAATLRVRTAVTTVALCCALGTAVAQQRGEVQVTARVVASAPSRLAVEALDRPGWQDRARGLYVVREPVTITPRPERDIDRPRRLVTIEFLAN